MNWFPQPILRPQGKAQYTLFRTPGLGLFTNPDIEAGHRAAFWQNGRAFFVVGSSLLEVFTDGTSTVRGTVIDDGLFARMEGNSTQLMVQSAGYGYILTFATNAFVEIADDFPVGNAVGLAYQDGYFLVGIANTNRFAISAINNGLAWDAADSATAEATPDYIRNLASMRQQIWIFKEKSTQTFNNTGAEFPFVPSQGEYIQYGIAAPNSLAALDNALFLIASDENGQGIVARTSGYKLQRISDYPLETAMAGYPTFADAEGQALSIAGRTTYRLTFPSANSGRGATWEFDANTQQWIELTYFSNGQENAHRGRVYTSAFGKILCGDRENGKIYELAMRYLDDAGDVIQRIRRAPHLVRERRQLFYKQIKFDGNVGIGLNVAEDALGYDPIMLLRWSDDAGKSFGEWREIGFGRFGEFTRIPESTALGMGRDRVFEITVTDPVDWCIAGVYLELSQGSR